MHLYIRWGYIPGGLYPWGGNLRNNIFLLANRGRIIIFRGFIFKGAYIENNIFVSE